MCKGRRRGTGKGKTNTMLECVLKTDNSEKNRGSPFLVADFQPQELVRGEEEGVRKIHAATEATNQDFAHDKCKCGVSDVQVHFENAEGAG